MSTVLFDLAVGVAWLTLGVLVLIAGLNLLGWLEEVFGAKAIVATFFIIVALLMAWALGFLLRVTS